MKEIVPDNATKSVTFRPTAENLAVRLLRFSNGAGIEVLAAAWFALVLSLLPNNTFQEGPPACVNNRGVSLDYLFIYIYTWYVLMILDIDHYLIVSYEYVPEKRQIPRQGLKCPHMIPRRGMSSRPRS